jgi:hypothetical protein
VFDAAVVDVTAKGDRRDQAAQRRRLVEGRTRGAAARRVDEPVEDAAKIAPLPNPAKDEAPHKGAEPELSPAQIQSKIDEDRALWNKYADGLREAALSSVKSGRARDAEGLFTAGSDIDKACENCHLEYWYPAIASRARGRAQEGHVRSTQDSRPAKKEAPSLSIFLETAPRTGRIPCTSVVLGGSSLRLPDVQKLRYPIKPAGFLGRLGVSGTRSQNRGHNGQSP